MPPTQIQPPPIHSSLAADPELGEMVAQFVTELPSRVAWLQRHLDAGDWESLRRAVHQLKGAAGSYGFDGLMPYTLRLETLLTKGGAIEEVTAAFQDLVVHCRSVTAAASD